MDCPSHIWEDDVRLGTAAARRPLESLGMGSPTPATPGAALLLLRCVQIVGFLEFNTELQCFDTLFLRDGFLRNTVLSALEQ